MALQHLGRQKGFNTDEWFPNLDGLESSVEVSGPGLPVGLKLTTKYPRQASDSHRKIWEALYWLRRCCRKQEEAATAGATGAAKITFEPFLPQNYGFMGLRDLSALGGGTALDGNDHLSLDVVLAQVDEASASVNYADTGGADAVADPMTIVPTAIVGAKFTLGRYFVWNDLDEDTVNVPAPSLKKPNRRKYEVSRIIKIEKLSATVFRWTVRRGLLGTFKVAHKSPMRVYPLDLIYQPAESGSGDLGGPAPATAGKPQPVLAFSPTACVVSVCARLAGGAFTAIATAPFAYPFPGPYATGPNILPPAPGMRTLTGAEYTMCISGTLAAGQFTFCPIHVSEGAAPRCVFAEVRVAPDGVANYGAVEGLIQNAALVVYVLYLAPPVVGQTNQARPVALVSQLHVPAGQKVSYPVGSAATFDPPRGRRQPYDLAWPWSTLKGVGTWATIFNDDGTLAAGALPLAFNGQDVVIEQDGEYFVLVARVGSVTPGADLTVEVQT